MQSLASPQRSPNRAAPPVRAPLAGTHSWLQRQCACGGAAGADGGCPDCARRKMLGLQARLAIGRQDDPLEQEAERTATRVMTMTGGAGTLAHHPQPTRLSRLASGAPLSGAEVPDSVQRTLSSSGEPLPASLRDFFEPRFAHDFSQVRVHHDSTAARSARDVAAEAYTVGRHVVFDTGRYAPTSMAGRTLLAHELTHVVQQSAAHPSAKAGAPLQVQRQAAPQPAATPVSDRLAAFQRLVKNAGKLRMRQNSRTLEAWRQYLRNALTPDQVQGQVHAEEVRSLVDRATRAGQAELAVADQWLRTSGPNRRWVMEEQIEGRLRACSGCHAAVQADAMDRARAAHGMAQRTPLQQLARIDDTGPRPEFAQGEGLAPTPQPGMHAAVQKATDRVNAVQPYLRVLGPKGYDVLKKETLGSTASPEQLVADIESRIAQRQADYLHFIRRIDAPKFNYLELRPIVRELLPLADADVRRAVEKEIEDAEDWEIVKNILVGAASIGMLVLIVFPPTTALGIGGAMALGGAVGAHAAYSGAQSFDQGRLYALGRGAHDVLDPAQQEAADAMMAMGTLNMVVGAMGVASSALGAVRLVRAPTLPGGRAGAIQAVEGEANGTMYKVAFGTPDPRVVITSGSSGRVIWQGNRSSLSAVGPRAIAGPRATAGPTATGGGQVFATEGNAARVAQPIVAPEPLPVAQPQAVPVPASQPAPTTRLLPDPRAALATPVAAGALDTTSAAVAPTARRAAPPQAETQVRPASRPQTRSQPQEERRPRCPLPTGLTPDDPIHLEWHKIISLYPSPIRLDGVDYHRDVPTRLPRGEQIGVPWRFWPYPGKVVQLLKDRRGSAASDFRSVLESYGFDWEKKNRRYLQADHVQDLQWSSPDGVNLDVPRNLWPYDAVSNASAGATQNKTQRVSFCEGPDGPAHIAVDIQSVKRPGGWGRYFVILPPL